MKVRQLPVGKQLLFGTLCAILLIVGGLFFLSLGANQLQQSRALDKLALIDDSTLYIGLMQAAVLRQLQASDTDEIVRLDQTVREIETINSNGLAGYREFVDTAKERELYNRVTQARKAYWEETQSVLALNRANRDSQATEFAKSNQTAAYEEFLTAVNELIKDVETSAQDAARAMTRFISEIRMISMALAGIAIATGFAVGRISLRLEEDNRTLQIEVTERKRAEEALRETEDKFRQLADNITDVFWITSPDFKTMHYVSAGYELVWGRTTESLYAHPHQWVEAILPEERERIYAAFGALREDEAKVSMEYRIARPDGTVRWVHDRGFQVRDGAGKVVRLTGIATDITDRRRIEDALQRQKAELQVLFDLMPAMIWFKDTDNGILRVNKRVAACAAKSVEEIEGKSSFEIYPEQAARFYADDLEVIRSGLPKLGIIETVQDGEGKILWIQTDKVPVCDKDGKVTGIIVMAQDVTERKRAEEQLRESEERFAGAFEHAPIGVALVSPNGRWLKVNRALCDLVGYSESELLAHTFQDITHPDDLEGDLDYVRQTIAGEIRSYQIEKRYVHARGHHVTVLLNVSLVRDSGSQPRYFIAQIQDITQSRKSEESLRLLGSAVEHSKESITITDALLDLPGPNIIFVNPAFSNMTGYTAKEVIGKTPRILQGPHTDKAVLRKLRQNLERGEPFQGEAINYRKDGKEFDLEWQVAPMRDATGKITHFVAIQRDITERKRAQAELESVHKQLVEASRRGGMAEIATNVLHSVGNVLNSVNVSASLAMESMKNSEAFGLARAVKLIREHESELGTFISSDPRGKLLPTYLAQLSENLLANQKATLKELDSLRRNIEHIKEIVSVQQSYASVSGLKEVVNIHSLVEDSLRMNVSALGRHGVELTRAFEDVPLMNIDKHKVLQVLVNLVRNAKYACEESGRADKRLTVRVTNGGDWLGISVIDNGVGVPRENLTRIFNQGFTTRKGGHGFGLHGSALAAKEMGGSLTVHSDGPGQGATFTLKLPSQPESHSNG